MPRLGFGLPLVSSLQESSITLIEDLLWEDIDTNNNISVNYQETRTNIILHSQDITDAEAWDKTNTTIDSTLYEAPDNSTTANAIKNSSTGEKAYKITQSSLSVTAGKTYTASVHLKKENLGFARLKWTGGTARRADFNLTTGAVTNTINVIRTQVDAMDDDWFRCSITFQADATETATLITFAQSAAGDSTPNVAVSGVVLLYVWGFQLEENSEPSAYIVTTTEARTATSVLTDFSNVWDFDSADLMPEADPQGEGAWETLDNIVLNGDYEELGSELLTNGDFTTDSDWGKGAGWTIANGKASNDGTVGSNNLSQVGILEVDKQYKIDITVSNYVSGNVQVSAGASPRDTMTANGTYTFYQTCTPSTTFYIIATSFNGSIDNVSVKQVDPNDRWTLTGGTSISDGKMTVTGASGTSIGFQSMLVQGTTYELTYTISNFSLSSGEAKINNDDGTTIQNISANGTFTVIFTHAIASGNLIFRATSGTNSYQVDNVTVREYAITPQGV